MPTLYQKQLQYIFDRPVTVPEWFWSPEENPGEVFEEGSLAGFTFIETFLANPGADLRPFSDDQVAIGLNYIFNNSCSDLTHDFKEADVPSERRVNALKSLINLFREVFEPRCVPRLSAGAEESILLINGACYMFWDMTPLSTWLEAEEDIMPKPSPETMEELTKLDPDSEDYLDKMAGRMPKPTLKQQRRMLTGVKRQYRSMSEKQRSYYHAIADVMEQCLSLQNPACIESALHGLGHMATFQPKLARPVIRRFLKEQKTIDPQLKAYARRVRKGRIL